MLKRKTTKRKPRPVKQEQPVKEQCFFCRQWVDEAPRCPHCDHKTCEECSPHCLACGEGDPNG